MRESCPVQHPDRCLAHRGVWQHSLFLCIAGDAVKAFEISFPFSSALIENWYSVKAESCCHCHCDTGCSQRNLITSLHHCVLLFREEVPGGTKPLQQLQQHSLGKGFMLWNDLVTTATSCWVAGRMDLGKGWCSRSGWELRVEAQQPTALPGRACEYGQGTTEILANICNTY